MDIREKRSDDGGGARRAALETTLAELRDQEAVLVQQIKLLKARDGKSGLQHVKSELPGVVVRPTLEPSDFASKQLAVRAQQQAREAAVWKDVKATIKHALSLKPVNQWFGRPAMMDPPPDEAQRLFNMGYASVISHPMDVGTINRKLLQGQYSSPLEVSVDMRLVITNCETYNVQDANSDVRKACTTLTTNWNRKAAGPQGFEQAWADAKALKKAEDAELVELEKATNGTLSDKIQYFDARVKQRLEQLQTPDPAAGSLVSFEQKRKLSVSISNLQMEAMYGLMEVIASSYNVNIEGSDEITLDIDTLPDAVLFKIQVYIDHAESTAGKGKRTGAPAPAPTPDTAKPSAPANGTTAAAGAPVTVKAEPGSAAAAAAAAAPSQAVKQEKRDSAGADSAAAGSAGGAAAEPSGQEGGSQASGKGGDGDGDKGAASSSSNSDSSSSSSGNSASSKGGDSDDEAGSKEKVASTMPDSEKKWTSAPGEDMSALVSTTRPPASQPQILKSADAKKAIEVKEPNAWAGLGAGVDTTAADAAAEPAAAGDDTVWQTFAKQAKEQEDRTRLQREDEERAKKEQAAEAETRKRKLDELKRAAPSAGDTEEERVAREAKRKRELLAADAVEDDDDDDEDLAFDTADADGDEPTGDADGDAENADGGGGSVGAPAGAVSGAASGSHGGGDAGGGAAGDSAAVSLGAGDWAQGAAGGEGGAAEDSAAAGADVAANGGAAADTAAADAAGMDREAQATEGAGEPAGEAPAGEGKLEAAGAEPMDAEVTAGGAA